MRDIAEQLAFIAANHVTPYALSRKTIRAQLSDLFEELLNSLPQPEPQYIGPATAIANEQILDKIADYVAPDEDQCWCDPDGKLESIGELIKSTGREIENWG